jgi:hypothetical protein
VNIVREIKDYGLYLDNCLSQEDINYILDLCKSKELPTGSSRLGSHTIISFIEVESSEGIEISNKIFEKIHPVMVNSMKFYTNHFGLDMNNYVMSKPAYWIKTYDIGASIGHHTDSWDSEDGKVMVPSVSIVLYLSSDFEGGEITFIDEENKTEINFQQSLGNSEHKTNTDNDITIKPSAGQVMIFDSNVTHAVKEVIGGKRISTDITYMNKIPGSI